MSGQVRAANARLVRARVRGSALELTVAFRAGLRDAHRAMLRLWDPAAADIDDRLAPVMLARRRDGGLTALWSLDLAALTGHEPETALREVDRNMVIEFGGERRARIVWYGSHNVAAHHGARSVHLLRRPGGESGIAIVRRAVIPARRTGNALRIAVLIEHLASQTGKTRALIGIAEGLAELGHAVQIALRWFDGSEPAFPVPASLGLIYADGPFTAPSRASAGWRHLADPDERYAAMLASLDADCVIDGGWSHALVRRAMPAGTPLILSDHDTRRFDLIARGASGDALLDPLRTHDAVHVVHPLIAERLAAFTDRPVVAIPNAVSVGSDPPMPDELFQTRRFVAVGRFTRSKRMGHVVEAFARIANELPDWRLDLFGTGDEFERVAAAAAGTPCADRITLRGFQPAMADELARGGVLVAASKQESFGLAVAEAMAAGCPAIAYDLALGHRSLLADDSGILVPDGNRQALAAAMLAAARRVEARDEALFAMTVRARERLDAFSPERTRQAWDQLVRRLHRQKRGRWLLRLFRR